MTDITGLATRMYKMIKWQAVPETVYMEDVTSYIADAIRNLYIMTGRALLFNENMFTKDEEIYTSFSDDLMLDEKEYVLVTA